MCALAERYTSKNLQFSHTKKFSVLFSSLLLLSKTQGPIIFLPHCLGSKSIFTLFLWSEKLCQRGIFAGKKNFYGVKSNDNCKSVLCALLITYFLCPKGKKKKCSVCLDSPWRHSLYVGCSLEHFNMDVCIYSTLMVELLQISRMMSDLEFIITIGVMQLITTSELSSIANCFMISILCSKCKRTACVTQLLPAETSSVGFLPPGEVQRSLSAPLQQLLSANAKEFQVADSNTCGEPYQQMIHMLEVLLKHLVSIQPAPYIHSTSLFLGHFLGR